MIGSCLGFKNQKMKRERSHWYGYRLKDADKSWRWNDEVLYLTKDQNWLFGLWYPNEKGPRDLWLITEREAKNWILIHLGAHHGSF